MYGTLDIDIRGEGVKMPAHPRPTVRRRRLGAELKRLREASNVSMDHAGEHIDGDKTKISRIENARQGIRPLELKALFALYAVEDEKLKTALLTLAREGKRKSWWQQYDEILSPHFQERLTLEADAVRVLAFQPVVVPGLLQIKGYAADVLRGASHPLTPEQIDAEVELRLERQSIFDREAPPQYVCILDEAILRREIGGPKVMAEQLQHLQEANDHSSISVQVIPNAHGSHAGFSGAFTVYSYPDPMELDVVGLDYLDGSLYLEEDGPVERYRRAFDQLRAAALSSRQSMDLISQVMRDLHNK
ncbi:helix-turn-helix transcriptional regulator [Streptomyces sp. H27-C3]|uniref:helix-turn-helix domain-containing protein n=1 Tax=Streptomyces sp. H27-C3 TaxID=3046305 RepID=UPI0024B976AF|nr:helix-turn-helix transcriptional regulator [Streptomyces sp. H27-C3]MDJ0463119.1 helix-turn-helix transcriptional regulator [Streptomyces sp. H27-C3]